MSANIDHNHNDNSNIDPIESLHETNNDLDSEDNSEKKYNRNKKDKKDKDKKDERNLKKTNITDINEDFKDMILTWLALDEKIKEINGELKEFKDEKKQFETYILEYMEKQKDDVILTTKGAITRNTKESKSAITPEIIQETLTKILNNKDTAYVYTNEILAKRTIKQTTNLKRQTIKPQKNNKQKNNNLIKN
jgi:hypothetical protein